MTMGTLEQVEAIHAALAPLTMEDSLRLYDELIKPLVERNTSEPDAALWPGWPRYTSQAANRLSGRACKAQRTATGALNISGVSSGRILFTCPKARRLARRAFRAQCKADRYVAAQKQNRPRHYHFTTVHCYAPESADLNP